MTETRKKIMIVDDEPYILRVLKMKLEHGGYEVVTAVNGLEALKMIDQEKPSVLITDIHMPIMDGRELCEMTRNRPDSSLLLTIVITSGIDRENRTWAEELDRVVFIEKPFSPRSILNLIDECFKEKEKAPNA